MSALLPEPVQTEQLGDVTFSVEAALVSRLGTESVSDKVLSLIELIKNSYDADATNVVIVLQNMRTGKSRIEVTDNGSGMTLNELKKRWMRVATSWKRKRKVTKKYHRKMLGLKGIGRFAVENLSSETTIISYPEKAEDGFIIRFNWTEYKSSRKDLSSIPNELSKFTKEPEASGLRIVLEDLHHRWSELDVQKLRQYIRSLVPPDKKAAKFNVEILTDEFADLAGKIDSDFLSKAAFEFEVVLTKAGEVEYTFRKKGARKPIKKTHKFKEDFKCGPLKFTLYFYYRSKGKMKNFGVDIADLDTFKKILDDYGNIRIYRDGIRISGFGNPDDDWIGLDALSRNDPSVVPARNQIVSTIYISSDENPEITDTTTRENIIKNQSFQDMVEFIKDSIAVFAQTRGEVEKKRKSAPKKGSKYVQKAKESMLKTKDKPPLLDFGKYPLIFYRNLEEEINICYASNLPNATLILSRKMVENLLYNLLEGKFPKEVNLWYNIAQGRTHDFSVLLQNLESKISDFNPEQRGLIKKLLALIKPFRREANSTAHKVIEYLGNIDDLDVLKIDEIVQIELELCRKVKAEMNPH